MNSFEAEESNRDQNTQTQDRPLPNTLGSSTTKQRDYIRKLALECVGTSDVQRAFCASDQINKLSVRQASNIITELLKLPKRAVEAPLRDADFGGVPKSGAASVAPPLPSVPEGRYAIENEGVTKFYIIDKPTEGRWAGRTFVNVQASDERYPIRNPDARRSILAAIAVNPREASERYGKELGACGICGRTLTDEDSRARGIGPICAGKMGWV